MTAHKGGQTCRATEGRREGGLFPRAHLMWQRVCDLPGVSLPPQSLKKVLPRRAEALLAAAGRGRPMIERSNFLFEVITAASSRTAADEQQQSRESAQHREATNGFTGKNESAVLLSAKTRGGPSFSSFLDATSSSHLH